MATLRPLRDLAVFAPCYIALDWASYLDPIGVYNITPWNPQPAIAVIWFLLGGIAAGPAIAATMLLSELVVRGASGGLWITLATTLLLVTGYALIATAIRRTSPRATLRSSSELVGFVASVLAGTAVVAAAFVGLLALSGGTGETPFFDAWLRFWTGDAVGLLVTAPLLFAAMDPRSRDELVALARKPEFPIQLLILCSTLWMVFSGATGDPATHFYVLFLPLIWIATRAGFNGAIVATAIVQLAVVLAVHSRAGEEFPLLEIQALVATLTLTGLFLGMVVDERTRVEDDLRQSLRLAAAGEMAGAITHEINQPLTALATYGAAARMLIERGGDGSATTLSQVIGRMLQEAERAAQIVKRLRDFFRSGSTRLEAVTTSELIIAARRIAAQADHRQTVDFGFHEDDGLPELYADRLQIEVILRNLIANAVEAVTPPPADGARVEVRIEAHDAGHLRIVVRDNGPGIDSGRAGELFRPFRSGKPTGMGLGLAVSRAIAEAHGGTIEAMHAAHGEFRIILPCQTRH
jgi:signal transduction histidine kinase